MSKKGKEERNSFSKRRPFLVMGDNPIIQNLFPSREIKGKINLVVKVETTRAMADIFKKKVRDLK